jgi:hypothetical protein
MPSPSRVLFLLWAHAAVATSSLRHEETSSALHDLWLEATGQPTTGPPVLGKGKCFDLPKLACESCPKGETNMCKASKERCQNDYCSPVCLNLAWKCDIEPGKQEAEKAFASQITPEEKRALCAEVIAEACTKIFECCDRDSVQDWLESRVYSEKSGAPLLPWGVCEHDAGDKKASDLACSKCKGSVSLKLTSAPETCVFGAAALANGQAGGTKMQQQKVLAAKGGGGSFKSFEERCAAVADAINGKLPKVYEAVKKNNYLCRCAGCCDPPDKKEGETCFFPLTASLAVLDPDAK